jgi:hypothetical protein
VGDKVRVGLITPQVKGIKEEAVERMTTDRTVVPMRITTMSTMDLMKEVLTTTITATIKATYIKVFLAEIKRRPPLNLP